MNLLIVNPVPEQVVRRFPPMKLMINRLKEKNIYFEFAGPYDNVWIEKFDVVFFWSCGMSAAKEMYGDSFIAGLSHMKSRCRNYNIPYVPKNSLGAKHSEFFSTWKKFNVPCPNFKLVSSADQIDLTYPVILRSDSKMSSGKNMHIACDKEEAQSIINLYRTNLAVEYIDTKYPDGFHRKWRCLIAGDRIFPRQVQLSKDWIISDDMKIPPQLDGVNVRANQEFMRDGEPQSEVLLKAAKVSGLDVCALDYFRKTDGSIIIFEGNRNFGWYGLGKNAYARKFFQQTGMSKEEVRTRLTKYMDAIIDMLCEARR